jgi:3-oxoacyl-[acyl-carrier protein] reductase
MNVAVTGEGTRLHSVVVEALRAHGAVIGTLPDVDAVVHPVFDLDPPPAPLATMDLAEWDYQCERPLRDALHVCQQAYEWFAGRGGRIVFVAPAFSLVGAAGHTALTAAADGVRALMRSASRQWAADGITLNTVAIASDATADFGPLLAFLAGPGGATVAGGTFVVDGGVVMLP